MNMQSRSYVSWCKPRSIVYAGNESCIYNWIRMIEAVFMYSLCFKYSDQISFSSLFVECNIELGK